MHKPLNIVNRVSYRGGWIGLFMGSTKIATLERGIQQLNSDGYQIVLMEPDNWGYILKLLSIMLLIITLGAFTLSEGFILIGQQAVPSSPRIDQPAVPSSPRIELRD